MNQVWDASKYAPKPLMTLCQVKVIRITAVTASEKVKITILASGSAIYGFWSDFRKERENDP